VPSLVLAALFFVLNSARASACVLPSGRRGAIGGASALAVVAVPASLAPGCNGSNEF